MTKEVIDGRSKQLRKEFDSQFTALEIDFYEDGESVQTFIFRADEHSFSDALDLYSDYDQKYSDDEFDGAFEDYLQELGIDYFVL